MATYFFDTSALVKRYYPEVGTDRVDEIIETNNEVVISTLLVIETVSAFRRKYDRGEVTMAEMESSIDVFFREALDEFMILPLHESLLTFSFDLILTDGLRTLDSLQLSAALSIHATDDQITFVTADDKLAGVATDRGVPTLVPG